MNDLKNKNLIVRNSQNVNMPISNLLEIENSSILMKINESVINTNLNSTNYVNLSNVTNVTGFNDESSFYDKKSTFSEKEDKNEDSEYSRKGKNIAYKYKNSLPSTMFKKREFVIDKSKNSTEEKRINF
jgi:hypothetical protein